MDKDILRIVIIVIGTLVIAGMLLWHYIKNRQNQSGFNFFDRGDHLGEIDDSLVIDTKDDDFDIIPLGGVNDHENSDYLADDTEFTVNDIDQEFQVELKHHANEAGGAGFEIPDILQFGIVSAEESGFNGKQLQQAFAKVGLKYGSNQVYERLDEYDQVDFSVASMVEPGFFPADNLESFICPGIVFFFQPKLVNDPLVVFDDFTETIHILAVELGGIEWDHNRQPLTADTRQMIRNQLVQDNLSL